MCRNLWDLNVYSHRYSTVSNFLIIRTNNEMQFFIHRLPVEVQTGQMYYNIGKNKQFSVNTLTINAIIKQKPNNNCYGHHWQDISSCPCNFLNQACADHRPTPAWFLKIDPVRIVSICVCVCVCVCVSAPEAIKNQWRDVA